MKGRYLLNLEDKGQVSGHLLPHLGQMNEIYSAYLSAVSLQKIVALLPLFHHVDSPQHYLHQKPIHLDRQPDLHMQLVPQFRELYVKLN